MSQSHISVGWLVWLARLHGEFFADSDPGICKPLSCNDRSYLGNTHDSLREKQTKILIIWTTREEPARFEGFFGTMKELRSASNGVSLQGTA